jgi:hypothetical protein
MIEFDPNFTEADLSKLIAELDKWEAEHKGKYVPLEDIGEFQRLVYTLSSKGVGFCLKKQREARGDAPLPLYD